MQETQVWSLGWGHHLEKEMTLLSVFLPGKFRGQRSLVAYSPRGCKELDVTEWLSTYIHMSYNTCLWSFITTQLWSLPKWPFYHNGISDLEYYVWPENKKVQVSYSFWNLNAVVEVSPASSLLDPQVEGPQVEGPQWRVRRLWQHGLACCQSLRCGDCTVHPFMWQSPHNSRYCKIELQSTLAEV